MKLEQIDKLGKVILKRDKIVNVFTKNITTRGRIGEINMEGIAIDISSKYHADAKFIKYSDILDISEV